MPTLVLSPRYTPDSAALWQAAIARGWPVERLHSHRPPDYLREKPLAIYGEALFANIVADELSLALLEPTFDWLAGLPEPYLSRSVRYTTLGDARRLTASRFIKPVYDKSFNTGVYESGKALPGADILPDELPVIVSEPVEWGIEFRCFVLNRQVVTSSIYSRWGELAQADDGSWSADEAETGDMLTFCQRLLSDTSDMPPAFVLDVGRITGRGWAVVEANPAWASGIYGCDPVAILPVLERACVRAEDLSDDDRRWVVERPV